MRRPSLLSQIVALNLLMVTAGILVAIFAAGFDFSISEQRWQFLVLALALLLTFLLNTLLLRRRFEPLERLLAMMERVDLSRPGRRLDMETETASVSTDIVRLAASFNRMLERLENERGGPGGSSYGRRRKSASGSPATCTTRSTSRSRPSCCGSRSRRSTRRPTCRRSWPRRSALPTRRWASCSTSRASCGPPRSTTMGWSPRCARTCATSIAGVRPARASGRTRGWGSSPPTAQVVVYRVAQEALVNAARHSGASRVEVTLEPCDSRVRLRVTDNGSGLPSPRATRASVSTACASARCWWAGRSRSTPGRGGVRP